MISPERPAFGIALRNFLVLFAVTIAVTTLVLLAAGAPPLAAYTQILKGSLGSWIKFTHVVKTWLPLTLCGCGLLFTFRINLWNIGIEGQMIMGAIFATGMLRLGVDTPVPGLVLGLAFVSAMAGGGIWALFSGWLKTKGGVNEIFAGLGLNFVAMGITLYLILGPWKRPGIASMAGTELLPRELWLPYILRLRLSPAAILIAIAAIVITALLLAVTIHGLRLRAVGANPNAAPMFGIRTERYMLLAMMFAGGFAGIAGCLQVTAVYHRLIPSISSGYGYLALMVVMLAGYRISLVPVVAFFFACLNVGSIQLPMVLQLDSSLSGVMQGVMVLTFLALHAWQNRRPKYRRTT